MYRSRSPPPPPPIRLGVGSLLTVVLVLIAVLVFLSVMPSILIDLWWYKDVGYLGVFMTRIWARLALFGLASLVCLSVLLASNELSFRISRRAELEFPPSRVIMKIPRLRPGPLRAVAVLVSLIFGFAISRGWLTVLTYMDKVRFGVKDPIFGLDLSFHVFTYPFLTMVVGAAAAILLMAVLISLPVLIITYVRYPDRRVLERSLHLRVSAAALLVLAGIRVYLARYALLRASNGTSAIPVGAQYMDVTYRLPFYLVASALLIVSGVVLFYYTGRLRRQDWTRGAVGVRWIQALGAVGGTLIVFSLVVLPVIDTVSVSPNEPGIQRKYIENHINFTLRAYGLDNVETTRYDPSAANLSPSVTLSSPTIRNARILDYRPTRKVFQQKQEIRSYYEFADPDVDRYRISREEVEVMIGAREIVPSKLQPGARTWANQHLVYTHGFGVVMAPVNTVDEGGLPVLAVKDIPPKSSWREIRIDEPRIYFGEYTNDYIVVGARGIDEFDYPRGDANVLYRYRGQSGIRLKNGLRRLVAAMQMGSSKLILSNYISKDSRLIIRRNVIQRIRLIAPFLEIDNDPYVFVENGRIYWMCTGISYSDRYPYSQYTRLHGRRVNYARDSVKIVTDAFSGRVRFYVIDNSDPIVRTYAKVFPKLFLNSTEMPEEFRRHLRYPEDLFQIQMSIYSTYHMTDFRTFYNKEDVWTPATEKYQSGQESRVEPYNILLASRGNETEFALIQPFTPSNKQNMIAWVSAMQDPDLYGSIMIYRFPKGSLVAGPMQIEALIDQDEEISKSISLWNTGGSKVIRGNTLVLPVGGSIIYIEPLYLSAEQSEIPELKKVIAAYRNNVVMADSLQEAVTGAISGVPSTGPHPSKSLEELISAYFEHMDKAEAYRAQGDFIRYGQELEAAYQLRKQIEELLSKSG